VKESLRFAELSGVRPMIESHPLEEAAQAYARMLSGTAKSGVVLTIVNGAVRNARSTNIDGVDIHRLVASDSSRRTMLRRESDQGRQAWQGRNW
jgi:hypothetical protein